MKFIVMCTVLLCACAPKQELSETAVDYCAVREYVEEQCLDVDLPEKKASADCLASSTKQALRIKAGIPEECRLPLPELQKL